MKWIKGTQFEDCVGRHRYEAARAHTLLYRSYINPCVLLHDINIGVTQYYKTHMTHYQNTARACRIVVDSDDYYFVINLTQTGCGNSTITCATIATLGFPEILFQPDEGGGNFKFDGRGSIILTHYDYNDCEYGIIQVYNINSSFKECECLKKP